MAFLLFPAFLLAIGRGDRGVVPVEPDLAAMTQEIGGGLERGLP